MAKKNNREILIQQAKAAILLRRREANNDFWSYCLYHDPKFFAKRLFLKKVADVFTRVYESYMAGIIRRLAVSMPPRAGKSYISSLFIAWMLGHFPEESVMRNCCSDTLYNLSLIHILIDCRNRLQSKGLLIFESGKRNEKSPVYYLNDLSKHFSKTFSKRFSKDLSKNLSKDPSILYKTKEYKTIDLDNIPPTPPKGCLLYTSPLGHSTHTHNFLFFLKKEKLLSLRPLNRSVLSEIYCGTFCFLTGYLMPPLADGRHIVLVNLVPPTDELKIDNYICAKLRKMLQ